MKFYTALILASFVNGIAAFSAVAPASSGASTGNTDPVDRSMRGIDKAEGTFDPTAGENAALKRNNQDQVWVPQVRLISSSMMDFSDKAMDINSQITVAFENILFYIQ